jgi:hypothetical protein
MFQILLIKLKSSEIIGYTHGMKKTYHSRHWNTNHWAFIPIFAQFIILMVPVYLEIEPKNSALLTLKPAIGHDPLSIQFSSHPYTSFLNTHLKLLFLFCFSVFQAHMFLKVQNGRMKQMLKKASQNKEGLHFRIF